MSTILRSLRKPILIWLKTISLCLLSIYVLVFSSCQKDPVSFPTFNDQGNIGIQGGIIKTSDGASIEIPEGTLTSTHLISIINTTEGDTVINRGCRIYELKPDGLSFSDSVIITLPFDDKYLDRNEPEDNYGVGIMVYQDSVWKRLKIKVNLDQKTAQAKITHFSFYAISFRDDFGDYFRQNRNQSPVKLIVPYYYQGNLPWCGYYALNMVTKYAGYDYRAPFIASLLNESTSGGLQVYEFPKLNNTLSNLGISTEIAIPAWGNVDNLSGYILKKLNEGLPVWIGSSSLNHAFVVTGHNSLGFYVHDPSGYFLAKAVDYTLTDLSMVHVPYDKFKSTLINLWDLLPFNGAECTILITSKSTNNTYGLSFDFSSGISQFIINKKVDADAVGLLKIDGQYKPYGYYLYNFETHDNGFDGSNYFKIKPVIFNGGIGNKTASLHYKIDNKEVKGSPIRIEDIQDYTIFTHTPTFQFQLSNLPKGAHNLSIELSSIDNPNVIFDNWVIPFTITNEFINNNTSFINESHNLDNNQVPSGWEFFETNEEVLLKDGHLIAAPVDAYGGLRRNGTMPVGTTQIKFEWDGNLAYTWWGMLNILKINYSGNKAFQVYLETAQVWSSTNNYLFLQYNDGTGNQIEKKKYTVPLQHGEFHYTVTVNNNQIDFKCKKQGDQQYYIDQLIPIPSEIGFSLQAINSYEFITYTTTDNVNWLDNISVTIN